MQGTGNGEVQANFPPGASLALGWTLLFLGVVGLFLPVVPGALLLLAGGNILRRQSPWVLRASEKCRERVRTHRFGAFSGSQVSGSAFKERCEPFRSPNPPQVSRLRPSHGTRRQKTFERSRNGRAQA
jgi:hypothetical protein